jgi:hypothetical protein
MSKSWDELKNETDFRIKFEKEWSRANGFDKAMKQQGTEAKLRFETLIDNFHRIDLNTASLREGIIALEDRLARIEERLDALEKAQPEDLDQHR